MFFDAFCAVFGAIFGFFVVQLWFILTDIPNIFKKKKEN